MVFSVYIFPVFTSTQKTKNSIYLVPGMALLNGEMERKKKDVVPARRRNTPYCEEVGETGKVSGLG